MKATDAIRHMLPCTVARTTIINCSPTQAWKECDCGAWMIWFLYRVKLYHSKQVPNGEEMLNKARAAYRDRSIPGSPAERIRTVVSARAVAIAAGKLDGKYPFTAILR